MADDLLGGDSLVGETLLKLVSRANAIIAELLRLSTYVPPAFKMMPPPKKAKLPPGTKPYYELLFDFQYLKRGELYETKIESSETLLDLDQEFRDEHLEILGRFYMLFDAIYKYIMDFSAFLEDLEEGVFIQLTLETLLLNDDGKQLMAEALYLYGVMLLLLDLRLPGIVRERLLISYLRYKGPTELRNIDEVCKLCRSTGFVSMSKKPPSYPTEYFARFPIDRTVVNMIIGRLRSDDIYSQAMCYPTPEHRSTALSTQAGMLYVLLWFAPDILDREASAMREIVDRHFPDNWVIPFYLGYTVDLSIEWSPYKAAWAALGNTLSASNIAHRKKFHFDQVPKLIARVRDFLTEGVLSEEYILDHHGKLMNCLRECNVTIRWLMLHKTAQHKKISESLLAGFSEEGLLVLLLETAQLEYELKKVFTALLDVKEDRWNDCQTDGAERMTELGQYFSGELALTRVKKNEQLQKWFLDIAERVTELDYSDSTSAGRKIQQLMQALEEVEQFEEIEKSIQVKEFLRETRSLLFQMLRIVNVKESYLVTMQAVSDMSYAWPEIIGSFVSLMQKRIRADPGTVLKLRSTFLKLSSMVLVPLVRIKECESPDLYSVTQYYSSELVSYVRRVLEVIPQSMFAVLNDIIELQTHRLKELPTKVPIEELKDFAQLDDRYLLAKATYAISIFTSGILAMETTLVGIEEVEPKQLLEEGIRRGLMKRIANTMHVVLQFKSAGSVAEFEAKLTELSNRLAGFGRSFQYIEDYVNMYGLKIWQEEFSRLVNYNVEQECNSFLKNKIFDHQSLYQSLTIPIPRFAQVDGSINFVGRLARALLSITSAKSTIYLDSMAAWYDPNSGKELVGIRTWDLLMRSVSVFGVSGLDKLYSFMIVKRLQTFVDHVRSKQDKKLLSFLKAFNNEVFPAEVLPKNAAKLYSTAAQAPRLLWPMFMDTLLAIGQMQLIKRALAHSLNFTCNLDSNVLFSTLNVMNRALVNDVRLHYQDPETHPYPAEDNPLLFELNKYLSSAGMENPFSKIYITTSSLKGFPTLLFLFVVSSLAQFEYNTTLRTLVSKKKKREKTIIDGAPFVVGVITLLKQFHSQYTVTFLELLGQYVRGMINVTNSAGEGKEGKGSKRGKAKAKEPQDYPPEARNVLLFLEAYCNYSGTSRKVVESYLPAYIFNQFRHA